MWRTDSLEKILMLRRTEGKRRGQQRMRWLHSTTNSMDMNLSKLRERVKDREAWRAAVHGSHDWATEQQQQYLIPLCPSYSSDMPMAVFWDDRCVHPHWAVRILITPKTEHSLPRQNSLSRACMGLGNARIKGCYPFCYFSEDPRSRAPGRVMVARNAVTGLQGAPVLCLHGSRKFPCVPS